MHRKQMNEVLAVCIGMAMGLLMLTESGRAENLPLNPGFEQPAGIEGSAPDDWVVYSAKGADIEVVAQAPREGSQCIKLGCIGVQKNFQGIVQVVSVEEDVRYTLSAWVMNNRADPLQGSAYGQLAIEWKNDVGHELARTWGEALRPTMSRLRWEAAQINKAQAPKGAVTAVIGIHLHEGDRGGKGSFFVDEVSFVKE